MPTLDATSSKHNNKQTEPQQLELCNNTHKSHNDNKIQKYNKKNTNKNNLFIIYIYIFFCLFKIINYRHKYNCKHGQIKEKTEQDRTHWDAKNVFIISLHNDLKLIIHHPPPPPPPPLSLFFLIYLFMFLLSTSSSNTRPEQQNEVQQNTQGAAGRSGSICSIYQQTRYTETDKYSKPRKYEFPEKRVSCLGVVGVQYKFPEKDFMLTSNSTGQTYQTN